MKCSQCDNQYLGWHKLGERTVNDCHITVWEITCMICHARTRYREIVNAQSKQISFKKIAGDYYV